MAACGLGCAEKGYSPFFGHLLKGEMFMVRLEGLRHYKPEPDPKAREKTLERLALSLIHI